MDWKNVINNPITSIGGVMAICGVVLLFMKQETAGIGLIGLAGAWVGISSKDANK